MERIEWESLKTIAREARDEVNAAARSILEEHGPLSRRDLLASLRDHFAEHPKFTDWFERKASAPGGTVKDAADYLSDTYYGGGGGIIAFKTEDGIKFAVRPSEAEDEPVDAVAADEIGNERAGVVYAFCYANDRKLAQLEGRDVFEIKIGKAANGEQRYTAHSGAAKTVMHALPELIGEWDVADRHAAERYVHSWLAYRDRQIEGGAGREWFLTNKAEIDRMIERLKTAP